MYFDAKLLSQGFRDVPTVILKVLMTRFIQNNQFVNYNFCFGVVRCLVFDSME